MNSDELKKILDDHAQWLRGNGGKCANLARSNLAGAYLAGSNLAGSNLAGSNLARADLRNADLAGTHLPEGWNYASVSFSGQGECGRRLHALRRAPDAPIEFSCGCFSGSEEQLREYIANGEERLRKSRLWALDTVKTAIDFESNQ
jgi:uncharacterized protein YjbI with pentapeptide repeats